MHHHNKQRSLAHAAYHARLGATPTEAVDLDRLILLHRLGHVDLATARTLIAQLRRDQDARRNCNLNPETQECQHCRASCPNLEQHANAA